MNLRSPLPRRFTGRFAVLTGVLVAASALRLWGLSDWWLNPDEGIYYSILTRADLGDFWSELWSNAHPPLYYVFLRAVGLLTWDFVWFRMLSVVAGVAAVAGVWTSARRLTGDNVVGSGAGLVAGLVLAFSPGAVGLSQVIRPYMLQLALLSWALVFQLRYFEHARRPDLVSYIGLLCVALATHYSSILALGVFCTLIVVHGTERGFSTPEWRRLALSHAVPAATLAVLYFIHLRPLWSSTLATEALDGWLSYFMIHRPADVWWSYLGLQRLLAHPWLHGPAALLILGSIGVSVARREWRITALVGSALAIAIAGASSGSYPFGSTRHSTWVMAFVVPGLAWLVARLADPSWVGVGMKDLRVRAAMPVALILLGGPVGEAIGMAGSRPPQGERILKRPDLARMVDAFDPSGTPGLMVMSAQSFYLFLPFYPVEREDAVFTPDRSVFAFPYGERQVLVSTAWDFTVREQSDAERVPNQNGVFDAPLGSFLDTASDAFPSLDLESREDVLLVVGGWPPKFLPELQVLAENADFVNSWESVPGLVAFDLDLRELRAALEATAGADTP